MKKNGDGRRCMTDEYDIDRSITSQSSRRRTILFFGGLLSSNAEAYAIISTGETELHQIAVHYVKVTVDNVLCLRFGSAPVESLCTLFAWRSG